MEFESLKPRQHFRYRGAWYIRADARNGRAAYKDINGYYRKLIGFLPSTVVKASPGIHCGPLPERRP
ncbi:MAG: hypothetical protein EA420_13225 [Candidatus Competibacteraceae bacterium]|nr:MAG: hypothetical protein EA420_13225 [Candidatus Competibacteraceae bacterium]